MKVDDVVRRRSLNVKLSSLKHTMIYPRTGPFRLGMSLHFLFGTIALVLLWLFDLDFHVSIWN